MRVAESVAFPNGITTDDSWDYVGTAFRSTPVGLSYARPSGYPALIRALSPLGPPFQTLMIVQHLIVLAIGATVYVLAIRLGVRRWIAVAAVAIIVCDSRLLGLEQLVMSEVLFLGLIAAAVAAAFHSSPRAAALSGTLLAFATLTRPIGLVGIPVIAAGYGLSRHWKAAAAACIAFSLPLLAYASVHQAVTGQFALTDMDGWYLYGRIGEIVDCNSADRAGPESRLCERLPGVHDPAVYIFLPQSPAWQVFGPPYQPNSARRRNSSQRLQAFAFRTIEEHPGAYARLTWRDLQQLLFSEVLPPQFPKSVAAIPDNPAIHRRFVPDYHPVAREPAPFLRMYEREFHLPQVGYLALAVAAVVGLARGRRQGRRLAGTAVALGLALICASAATAGADFRYTLPSLPLLVLGAATAMSSRRLGSTSDGDLAR